VQALARHVVAVGDLGHGPLPLEHFLHCVVALLHDPSSTSTIPTSSRGPRWPPEQAGAGVKHLVELSKIRWNCVKHQPEPIRKASAEVAHDLLTCTPRRLPGFSPLKASRSGAVARLCMGDGPDSEPDCQLARRSGRSVAPPGRHLAGGYPGPRWVAVRFPSSSGRRARVRDRNPSSVGRISLPRHGEELNGDRTGTDSEPRSLRIEPHGERMGTEWGLGPLKIEQTTEDVTAIHRLAASRLRGRRLPRHRRPVREPTGDPRQGRRHGP
jgi:hypothetical protein